MSITVSVTKRGPVFDGRAARAVEDYRQQAMFDVASQGLADVHRILDASIRNPTPYYETQIMVERQVDAVVVHDRGIIYGPWLEGIGSRNRTTRFKGYGAFRKAAQELQEKAGPIAERALPPYLRRMN